MPPPLALALCTGFVLILLWLERRESRDVSAAVWIPTVWFMSVSSKSLGMWFGTVGSNEAGSPLDRLFLAGIALAGLAVLMARPRSWPGTLRHSKWLLVLLGYMLVSTLWSDITAIALRRWVREALVVIMLVVLVSEAHPQQAVESLLSRAAYILMPFSLLLIKYYPALGVAYAPWSGQRMWIGVSVHKNSLSALCLVFAFFLSWALYRRWRDSTAVDRQLSPWADVSVLLITLFLLKGEENAYSATSLATFGVGVLCLAGLVWLRNREIAVSRAALTAILIACIVFGASAPFVGGANTAAFSSALGRDETLTGRTDTWRELVPVVMSRPLFGFGFGSFWTTERRDFFEMSHGHNGYLDSVLQLGFVGLALFVGWMLSCARRLQRSLTEDYYWGSLGICFLLMLAIYNTAESALGGFGGGLTTVALLVTMTAPQEALPAVGRFARRQALPGRDRGRSGR